MASPWVICILCEAPLPGMGSWKHRSSDASLTHRHTWASHAPHHGCLPPTHPVTRVAPHWACRAAQDFVGENKKTQELWRAEEGRRENCSSARVTAVRAYKLSWWNTLWVWSVISQSSCLICIATKQPLGNQAKSESCTRGTLVAQRLDHWAAPAQWNKLCTEMAEMSVLLRQQQAPDGNCLVFSISLEKHHFPTSFCLFLSFASPAFASSAVFAY